LITCCRVTPRRCAIARSSSGSFPHIAANSSAGTDSISAIARIPAIPVVLNSATAVKSQVQKQRDPLRNRQFPDLLQQPCQPPAMIDISRRVRR